MKTNRTVLGIAAATIAMGMGLVMLSGCSKSTKADSKSASMGVMNTKCPYSGNAVNPDVSSEFAGQKIGFCCGGCKGKFDKATDATKTEMMNKVVKK